VEQAGCGDLSWQKALGGEAAHGMLALSPRAVTRLESYTPPWPLPEDFPHDLQGQADGRHLPGRTINTPSMVAVEDWLDALGWAESLGGLPALIARSNANLKVLEDWVARSDWAGFLAAIRRRVQHFGLPQHHRSLVRGTGR